MKEYLDKFIDLEKQVSQRKGDFFLFALFLREDAQDKWDLVVAAPWIEKNQQKAINYLAAQLQQKFSAEELIKISRIVVIDQANPALKAITRAIKVEHGDVEVQNSNFFGLQISQAYILTARMPDETSLLRHEAGGISPAVQTL